jgi:hypothetical protein
MEESTYGTRVEEGNFQFKVPYKIIRSWRWSLRHNLDLQLRRACAEKNIFTALHHCQTIELKLIRFHTFLGNRFWIRIRILNPNPLSQLNPEPIPPEILPPGLEEILRSVLKDVNCKSKSKMWLRLQLSNMIKIETIFENFFSNHDFFL